MHVYCVDVQEVQYVLMNCIPAGFEAGQHCLHLNSWTLPDGSKEQFLIEVSGCMRPSHDTRMNNSYEFTYICTVPLYD